MDRQHASDLLQRARSFDLQALAEIYDAFSPGIYAYACRLLGDDALTEDCVAETFSRFLQGMKAGNGPHDFLQAYLYRIAHNWISDQYRRQPPPPLALDDELCLACEQHPESIASERLEQQKVRAAFQRLTPDQRQVMVLKFIEGWENQEIAAAIQKPVGAVKSLQHRALAALKRMLIEAEEKEYEPL